MKKRFLLIILMLSLYWTYAVGNEYESLRLNGTREEGIVIKPNGSINSYELTKQFTISSWIKVNKLNIEQPIIFKQQGLCKDDFYLEITTQNSIKFGYNGGCKEDVILESKPDVISLKKWYHIAIVVDGKLSKREIKLYLNGISLNSRRMTNINPTASEIPLVIGNNRDFKGRNMQSLIGQIAEVQFYNVASTQSQIKERMNRTLSMDSSDKEGLIGYWSLNGNSLDASPNQNNGSLEGKSDFISQHPFTQVLSTHSSENISTINEKRNNPSLTYLNIDLTLFEKQDGFTISDKLDGYIRENVGYWDYVVISPDKGAMLFYIYNPTIADWLEVTDDMKELFGKETQNDDDIPFTINDASRLPQEIKNGRAIYKRMWRRTNTGVGSLILMWNNEGILLVISRRSMD